MASAPPVLPRIDFDSEALDLKLKLQFPADLAHVDNMVQAIMHVVRAIACARDHEHEIELALGEALANAVLHGAHNNPEKLIECRVACDQEHGMLIVVSDPGTGFDLTKAPDPLRAENLYSSHGRGIFLINTLMDRVEFKRGGTEIHMRKFAGKRS